MVYFYARWRHEPDSLTFDYPFLETAGRGHFVGVAMPIDHPLGGWWGEGDEKVWVDDDGFPPYIGTGSEDYFGDAWGIRYLSGPSFGASSMKAKDLLAAVSPIHGQLSKSGAVAPRWACPEFGSRQGSFSRPRPAVCRQRPFRSAPIRLRPGVRS